MAISLSLAEFLCSNRSMLSASAFNLLTFAAGKRFDMKNDGAAKVAPAPSIVIDSGTESKARHTFVVPSYRAKRVHQASN